MNRSTYRLLVFFTMFIVMGCQAALVTAQDDMQEPDTALNMVCPEEENLGGLLDTFRAEHPGHENPPIDGLLWHRDELFSFFVPTRWQRSDGDDGRTGVLYTPDPRDPLTVFAVEVTDLEAPLSVDGLARLDAENVDASQRLPEGDIELHDDAVVGAQMQLEYTYTFREGCAMRKRWVRVFYHGTREITMIAQGSTLDMYDYWLPWFFEAMTTA
jgi:hypothetical protein